MHIGHGRVHFSGNVAKAQSNSLCWMSSTRAKENESQSTIIYSSPSVYVTIRKMLYFQTWLQNACLLKRYFIFLLSDLLLVFQTKRSKSMGGFGIGLPLMWPKQMRMLILRLCTTTAPYRLGQSYSRLFCLVQQEFNEFILSFMFFFFF